MPKQIEIEVPEEIHALIESDPFMKLLLERVVREEAVNYALSILTLDKLTEDSMLTEDDAVKVDRKVKEGIGKRVEDENNR
ncbi:MAG: hypothetical protein ACPL4E_05255 [Thermoproteota archaeon]